MVKASPTAAFVVTETEFLLEFEIISLDPPAKFGLIDRTFERDVGGPCGKPVVIRFGFTLRPLDQQPLFSRRLAPPGVVVGRADLPSGKPRGWWRVAAVPPGDCLPPWVDTAGTQPAGFPDGWIPTGSLPLAVVLLAHLTAVLPRHTDRVATFPRVKPEDKPWEILCRR